MGTDALQFEVPGAWSSSQTKDHFWIVPGVLGLKLPCRHFHFAGRKQGTHADNFNFRSSLKSPAIKGRCTTQKKAQMGFNIPSNASTCMSLIFPGIFHGVLQGNPPICDGLSHRNSWGHHLLQRQRHALVAALARTTPERLAQQRRQVALSLQAVQALQLLGFELRFGGGSKLSNMGIKTATEIGANQ